MKILKTSDKNFLQETIEIIKAGKVVIFPTDTVYGLIANAAHRGAVGKLFAIKKRPKAKPIPIFVKDLPAAKKLAKIDKNQGKFLRKVWPGKITAVLERKRKEKIYGIAGDKIALRIPGYKLVNVLLEKINFPLTGTSANVSGRPSSVKIKEILRQFQNEKERPDLIIDAGNLNPSRPSKIIDLTNKKPKILRK